jgi:hypothetical protein
MKTTFKAGTYYIGDPCYVINDRLWSEWCDILFSDKDYNSNYTQGRTFEFKGHKVATGGTKWGDGSYGDGFSVDSGSIGIVPEALITERYALERINELGKIITFDKEFEVEIGNGHFKFDTIEIETDYDLMEEEEVEDE